MKTLLASILIVSTLFLAGCGSLLTKGEPKQVNISQPIYAVDSATGQLTKVGETNVTANVGQYQVNPKVQAGVDATQAALTAAGSIPSPASPLLLGLAGLLTPVSALLALYARKKNGELTLSNAALAATTLTIEAADNAIALKEAARKAATANGSNDYLHSAVKNL